MRFTQLTKDTAQNGFTEALLKRLTGAIFQKANP